MYQKLVLLVDGPDRSYMQYKNFDIESVFLSYFTAFIYFCFFSKIKIVITKPWVSRVENANLSSDYGKVSHHLHSPSFPPLASVVALSVLTS